ncbi:MAG: PilW family protein [Methylobacter sp.]|nr:PilW family protein [Methylobacter sp.]
MNIHQRGYTLIELMISLLLGLMMISGFGSLFVQTQKNATIQRSLSYMMEDGRYILEVFGREFRRTGSLKSKMSASGACDAVLTADPNVLGSTMSFSACDYIRGQYNAAGFGTSFNINELALKYQLNNNIDPSTGKSAELASDDPSSTNSACERSILLTPAEDTAPTQVHVVTLYFYVALDASNIPVLYCVAKRQNLSDPTKDKTPNTAEPLISNVQQLLITYGIDDPAVHEDDVKDPTDTITDVANYYVGAGSVTDWQRVVAARLSVVLRSEDDNLTKSSVSYTPIDGTTYTATDKRFYREFSTTIAFRNKI